MYQIKYILLLFNILIFFVDSFGQNCPFSISIPQDITICAPANVSLNGSITGTYVDYEWTGSNGFTTSTSLNPSVFVDKTTTFKLSAFSLPSVNLIINGDFSGGNTGFTTSYLYNPDLPTSQTELVGEGTYSVVSNPNSVHPNFSPCSDHGPGTDMMVINGAASLQQVWCQTIAVMPNTNYIFQAFATSVESSSPAILQFSINGNLLGTPFVLSSVECDWQEFYTSWNSGGNTSVEICITNQNTATGGNDFAIDDLFFGPVCDDEKEFTVTYAAFNLEQTNLPFIDCLHPIDILEASPNPADFLNYGFEWNTANGNIQSDPYQQVINISYPGLYSVTVTNQHGCTKTQNFEVPGDLAVPIIDITGDLSLDCYQPSTSLSAGPNNQNIDFSWILPDSTTSLLKTLVTSLSGEFFLMGVGPNGCEGRDSVTVIVDNSQIPYAVDSSDVLTCNRTTAQVFLNLGANVDSIVWTGTNIVSQNDDRDTITVGTAGIYTFTLHIGSDCIVEDSIMINRLPPSIVYGINVADTLSCNKLNTQLILKPGLDIASYAWQFKGQTISTNDSIMADTVGTYTVILTDKNGCQKTDSLVVIGDYLQPTFSVVIDTIDCFDKLGQFITSTNESVSFNWQGNGFSSTDSNPTFSVVGDYTLTVTGRNGCQKSQSFYLPSSEKFPSIVSTIKNINCSNPTGQIDLSTNIPATYTWIDQYNNTGNSSTINSNFSNTYSITARTAAGCESNLSLSITLDAIHPTLAAIAPGLLTCQDQIFIPKIIASNYTTFDWTGGKININNLLEPTFSSPGNYLLTLRNDNGCIKSETLVLTEDRSKPTFTASAPNLTCISPQSAISLAANNNLIYHISPSNQIVQNGYKITNAGTYTITATNELGCDSSITFTINANLDTPVIEPRPISLNCANPTMYGYDLNFDPSLRYTWSTQVNQILSDSLLISSNEKTSLTAINQYGCISTKEVNIKTDFETPIFSIVGDSIIRCGVASIKLNGNSLDSLLQYSWSNNGIMISTVRDIDISASGTFTINVVNPVNGCADTKSVNITKQPEPTSIEYKLVQPLCFGEKGNFEWKNIISGTAPFDVTIDNEIIFKNIDKLLTPGRHQVAVADANGCTIRDQFIVDEPFDFSIEAGRDTTINLTDEYQIIAKSDVAWSSLKEIRWTPSSTLSCDDCPNPFASPAEDTEYQIDIVNNNDCIRTDKIWVRTKLVKGYEAPNVFNPGSTTGNGKFTMYPRKSSLKSIKQLRIFDRWGNMVFETSDIPPGEPSYGWDGSFHTRQLQPDVYIWVAELLYKDETIENIRGDVTILK